MLANRIVSKFGGTSLATADQVRKVIKIVLSNLARRFVVVSAPGARLAGDKKVTDLLYGVCRAPNNRIRGERMDEVQARFVDIAQGLGLEMRPEIFKRFAYLASVLECDPDSCRIDEVVATGEYLMARILAQTLRKSGFEFLDARDFVSFDAEGMRIDMEETKRRFSEAANAEGKYVIPGFYGVTPGGKVQLMSRGGSDLTGAVVSAIVGATCYENWSDVSGVRMAHPVVVPEAKRVQALTYREMRELSYLGASVLHHDVLVHLQGKQIPTVLKNTNDPQSPGTFIAERLAKSFVVTVAGIAGKRGFSVVSIEKIGMNDEIGFVSRVAAIFARHNVSIEHMPGSIDSLSVVVPSCHLGEAIFERVRAGIMTECNPDRITVSNGLALVAVVGEGMAHIPGIAAKAFAAIAHADVNVRMITQGASEVSIIVGVDADDLEKTIRSLYSAFA